MTPGARLSWESSVEQRFKVSEALWGVFMGVPVYTPSNLTLQSGGIQPSVLRSVRLGGTSTGEVLRDFYLSPHLKPVTQQAPDS